jgi:serine/threonine protein kinase/WD40 repeat protein
MNRCPDLAQLDQLLADALSADAEEAITAHLDECPLCSARFQALTDSVPLPHDAHAIAESPPSASRLAFLESLKTYPLPDVGDGRNAVMELPTVPGYEVLGILGRGGMGVVYLARQVGLGRLVALKMISAGPHASPEQLRRFRQEAEAAAGLQHPNIVQIYHVGEQDSRPYFSLEYVAGGSLATALDGTPWPPEPAARLVETLARAVQVAHDHGIVHRDLKPANVLLSIADCRLPIDTQDGSAPPQSAIGNLQSAIPKITDFGLAKRLEGAGGQTESGSILGTPSYMAPEQAQGRSKQVGPAADVYALGAILYELLTGRPPFRAATPLETLLQVINDEPVPPRRLQSKLPHDLETICLKCLAKEATRRYPGAPELAGDLRCFLEGSPIRARPPGSPERLLRWARRNPRLALLGAAVVVLLLGLAGTLSWALVASQQRVNALAETDRERQLRDEERQREAEEQRRERERDTIVQQMQLLRLTPHGVGWSDEAWKLALQVPPQYRNDRVRDEAAATLDGFDVRDSTPLNGPGPSMVAFNAAGDRLLTGGRDAGSHQTAVGARICNVRGKVLAASRPLGPGPVAFRPDGTALQLAAGNPWALEASTLGFLGSLGGQGPLLLAGQELLGRTPPGETIVLWDVAADRPRQTYHLGRTPWRLARNGLDWPVLALSRDGSRLAAATEDGSGNGMIAAWDAASGQRILEVPAGHVTALAFSPDSRLLACGQVEGRVDVRTVDSRGTITQTLPGGGSRIHGLAFSPNATRLAVSGAGGTLLLHDLGARETLRLLGSSHDVYCVTFSPDGALLASGGRGNRLWDAASGRFLVLLAGSDYTSSLAFSPDATKIAASWDWSGTPSGASIMELSNGRGMRTLHGLERPITHVRFSPNGRWLAALAHNWEIGVWDLTTGFVAWRFRAPRGEFADNAGLTFSPDSRRLACAAGTGAKLWDLATGGEKTLCSLPGRGLTDCLAFTADGRKLLHLRRERAAETKPWLCPVRNLLDPDDPTKPLFTIEEFNRHVQATIAAPDGTWFVAAGIHEQATGAREIVILAFDCVTRETRWQKRSQVVSHWPPYPHVDFPGKFVTLSNWPEPEHTTVVNPSTGESLLRFPCPLCWLATDGSDLGLVRRSGELSLIRCRETKILLNLEPVTRGAYFPEASPDQRRIAWGNSDGTVTVCDLETVRRRLGQLGFGW